MHFNIWPFYHFFVPPVFFQLLTAWWLFGQGVMYRDWLKSKESIEGKDVIWGVVIWWFFFLLYWAFYYIVEYGLELPTKFARWFNAQSSLYHKRQEAVQKAKWEREAKKLET